MTHKIKAVKPLKNCVISAVFFNGTVKEYDIKKLYATFPQFKVFDTNKELFENVQVDIGGYGISWNDELDLDAEDIWEDGIETGDRQKIDIVAALAENLVMSRDLVGLTQKQLSEITGIYQADISKIERGLANPSLSTLKKLADGLNMILKVEFVRE